MANSWREHHRNEDSGAYRNPQRRRAQRPLGGGGASDGTSNLSGSNVPMPEEQWGYPLPAFLKFCPGGITHPSPAPAATNPVSSSSSPSSFWNQLSDSNALVQRELCQRLIQEARTADDRLRKYALLYHHQALREAGGATTSNAEDSLPPLVMPSLSVLCEAAFGRLTGVPPEFAKEWADAMVLAHLDADEAREQTSGITVGTTTMAELTEVVPESEEDIWNAKPKAVSPTSLQPQQPSSSVLHASEAALPFSPRPAFTFNTGRTSPASSSTSFSLAYRLKERLAAASMQATCKPVRRPCGYVFGRGDIAWNCRTCQTDPTCVICDECFRQSDHEGHEVYFHRTSPGGCCDCGDVEAWNIEGCCPIHRPDPPPPLISEDDDNAMDEADEENMEDSDGGRRPSKKPKQRGMLLADPLEAVRTAHKGQELQQETIRQAPTALPAATTAALATVIGAAVSCLVKAVDGAGMGADPVQFKTVWAHEATQIALGYSWPEEAYNQNSAANASGSTNRRRAATSKAAAATPTSSNPQLPVAAATASSSSTTTRQRSTNATSPQPTDFATGRKLPRGYQLQLRLHNDDVHTFEEVIDALHEPRSTFRRANEQHPHHGGGSTGDRGGPTDPSLVPLREQATEMTHHVDADGQVTVKAYDNCVAAMQGYRRLKTRGLHCAVVSTAQLHLEQRAKQLASWLTELSSAHPVAAALCVHALVQVDPHHHTLAGYHVWPEAHSIPPWAGSNWNEGKEEEEEDEMMACRRRFQAFPPHLTSSYCTRLEALRLHGLARHLPGFVELTMADPHFYQSAAATGLRRLSLERYRKSPHALWGTLPALYNDSASSTDRHPLLKRLALMAASLSGTVAPPYAATATTTSLPPTYQQHSAHHLLRNREWERQRNQLTESVYVVDTDLRKQQEADRISSSVYPHKLPGLHLLLNTNSNELPNPMEMRHLLAISSYRAPMSSILLLLLLDPYPTKQLRGATHALFLSLLTDSRFKCRFAGAFGVAYRPLSTLFCAGVGTEADTPLHFSVQILTAGSLVRALGHAQATEQLLLSDDHSPEAAVYAQYNSSTTNNNTLGVFCLPIAHTIARCVHTNLLGATKEVNMILNNTYSGNDDDDNDKDDGQQSTNSNDTLLPALTYVAGEHPLLTLLPAAPDDGFLDARGTRHKRLPHLLRDLEYVIETPGTAMRLLLFSRFPVYQGPSPLSLRSSTTPGGADDVLVFPTVFARLLRLAQGMDPQKRKISGGHVEYEQTRWLEAFGLSLNIASSRDALAESPAKTDAEGDTVSAFREAMGNLNAALLREIKLWLYREGLLETGLPVPSGGGLHGLDLAQAEALQRSTLHVSGSTAAAAAMSGADHMDTSPSSMAGVTTTSTGRGSNGMLGPAGVVAGSGSYHAHLHHHHHNNHNMVALSCATGVKMTEHQLGLIENALKAEGEMRYHRLVALGLTAPGMGDQRFSSPSTGPSAGLVMGDWLRVPHSPLAGDSLSFHLPLHRALAKSVRSLCSVAIPDSVREANPTTWWKIPVLDDDPASSNPHASSSSLHPSSFPAHPLVPLLKSTLRSSNCRVVWMLGPDCTPQEAQRRRSRARNVSAHIAVTKVLHSLADHPIRCLAAAQQIERHLWARNGSPVAGMAMNYTSTPLCRSFRDLDLLLVQLSASGWNVGLGSRRVYALLLSRFNMDGHLCDPERRTMGGGSAATGVSGSSPAVAAAAASMMHHHSHHHPGGMVNQNSYLWVNPPRLQDPDHAVVLSESFFSTLCVLVTELPPPPPRSSSDSNSLHQSIRRELLHALASEPRSRSEAMAAAALGVTRREESEGSNGSGGGGPGGGGATNGGLFRATFAEVLDLIGQAKKATRSRTTTGAPPSFELSANCCEEYDPTFFHLRRQEHQHAMDVIARLRKQKFPNYCLPLVCPPPKAHPRFLPCRLLLHLPALDASIRRALLFALTGGSWLPPPEPVVVPQDDLHLMDDDDGDDDDVILNDRLARPSNISVTATGDVVITGFGNGSSSRRGPRLTPRTALSANASPTSSFLRRHQSHDSMDPNHRGKPFSQEVVDASAISFLEVLQLLTLQAHTLEECASLHRTLTDLDEESRLISSGLSINTYLSRLVWIPDSLVDVWALRPSSRGGPLDSKGSGERRGSVLGLLIALYEHRADHYAGSTPGSGADEDADGNATTNLMDEGHHGGARRLAAHGLKWLLRFVRALVDGATSVTAAAKSATTGVPIVPTASSVNNSASGSVSIDPSSSYIPSAAAATATAGWTIDEGVRRTIQDMLNNLPDLWPQERGSANKPAATAAADSAAMSASQKNKEAGKEAQRRVMELMVLKQRKFAETIDDDNDAAGTETDGVREEECIICRCDDSSGINGPLGYLGHVQRSRVSQMRAVLEADLGVSGNDDTSDGSHNGMLMKSFRVVGHMGCQLRETEALDSKPLMCLPRGSVVTVLRRAFSAEYGILSRRVLVRHVKKPHRNASTFTNTTGAHPEEEEPIVSEGWASIMSSQGYVILSPLVSMCYSNSKWGATRPIVMQCGHAAHLKCVEKHTLSLHQRAAGEQPYDGRFAANIADGEFLCPLCKQLSNILIPRDAAKDNAAPGASLLTAAGTTHIADQMEVDTSTSPRTGEASRSSRTREVSELFHVPRLARRVEEDPTDLRMKALEDFGSHLYQAMEVSWDRTTNNRKKQQKWHPAIRKWDYEEEASAAGGGSMGLPRLLRQQLIACAAVGHSAAAAEAGARGVEEVLPFGISSQTSDPWSGFNQSTFHTHSMLRELKRTLSGASGLLEALCVKMTNRLSVKEGDEQSSSRRISGDDQTPVILKCFGDMLEGRSWIVSLASMTAESAPGLAVWTEVTALTAALPCHVARDGVLSLRCEARATAAGMWATKGCIGGAQKSSSPNSNNPTVPLAVRNVLASVVPPLRMPDIWGSSDPCLPVATQATGVLSDPFCLGIASGYMYTPLLSWDLNTFSGAVFSALLLQDVCALPNSRELLQVMRMLMCARIVQAIALPGGFELPGEDDLDDEECWETDEEVQTQGAALLRLVAHIRAAVSTQCLNPNTGLLGSTGTDGLSPSPLQLLAGVSRAILPFARSLVLMVRATAAITTDRQSGAGANEQNQETEADKLLNSVLLGDELMDCEDGFLFVKALRGPLPVELVAVDDEWFPMINRWLISFVGFEIHQGSSGGSLLSLISEKFDGNAETLDKRLSMEHSRGTPETDVTPRTHQEEPASQGGGDQIMAEAAPAAGGRRGGGNANQRAFRVVVRGVVVGGAPLASADHEGFGDDVAVDEVDMDDAEEMVELADALGAAGANTSLSSAQDDPHESSDENSESGSEDGFDNSSEFANVSRSPIIPYQSSFLGMDQIGPGRHGAMFEYGVASAVMSDMSHLSLVHRKFTPTFNLVRLPKSFVELYNIVSKVKGREESGGTDEQEDVGNSETAICLLTGTVMRSGSPRRSYNRSIRPPGACTLHARKHGSGIGIFFLVQKCTVLLMHNNKSAYSPSIFVDEHGEEDPGLRRGRPLFLNDVRYRALELMWRHQGIPREVAQIRSTSDRVIRDNWY